MQMTPTIYTRKRDELLHILGPVSVYPELNAECKTAFKRSMDKLQSESFEIVLIGEFQGGKSTTFNAICDGRYISPIGIGIKTSACKISAQNIVDPNEEERAVIRWKTDDELILTLLDFLRMHLDDKEYQKIAVRDSDGHFTNFSLDNSKNVQCINECLAKEWEVYKNCPAKYDPDYVGKLDLLYVASLIMHFRTDPLIEKLRKETLVTTIEEMQPYVVFPLDWATRWGENDPGKFESKEIVLAFVADVHCYLHSPNLKRLGCVITDSPGLFAGPWDTMVAQEAMLQADAILYLLPGQNAIGMKELVALKEIQRTKQFHKVFFAMNARSSHEHLRNVIRPANASTIDNSMREGKTQEEGAEEGFRIKPEDISIFNARLAYNAKHRPFLQGEDAEDKWMDEVESDLCTFLGLNRRRDEKLLEDLRSSLEDLSRESQYDELLNIVETMVVQKKACSLLYANGILPVDDALAQLEGWLKKREDEARNGYQNAEAEAKKAKVALEEFKTKSKQVVDETLDDKDVDSLSTDFVQQVYLDRTGAIASNIMGRTEMILNDSKESLRYIVDMLKRTIGFASKDNTKGFARTIQGYVSKSIEEECLPAANGWLTNVVQGKNKVYNERIVEFKLKSIALRIKQLWEDLILSTPEGVRSYFQGLKPNVGSNDASAIITGSFDGSGTLQAIRSSMLKMFATKIGAVIGAGLASGVAMIVAGFILGNIFTGGVPVVALLAAYLAAVALGVNMSIWFQEKFSQKIRDALRAKLQPELEKAFLKQETQKKLKDSARTITTQIIDAHKKFYADDWERLSVAFQERYDEMEINRKKSKSEQEKIANQAAQVRSDIENFRQPIQQFITEVRPYFE